MKYYEVTKKDSELKMRFETYQEASEFCNSFLALENARGAEFPELHINIIYVND